MLRSTCMTKKAISKFDRSYAAVTKISVNAVYAQGETAEQRESAGADILN